MISYFRIGVKVNLSFKEISQISFAPTRYFIAGIFPVTIFDIAVLDTNGGKHKLVNISDDGYKRILLILKNYPMIQTEHKEKTNGLLVNGFIRFL